jgi:hypothetical protein
MVMQRPSVMDLELWRGLYKFYTHNLPEIAIDVVRPAAVLQLLKTRPSVDAVVTLWPSGALFAELLDCPLILFSPNAPMLSHGTTNVINFSLQPFVVAPFIEPMTLPQRLANHAIFLSSDIILGWVSQLFHRHQAAFLQQELGVAVPPPATIMERRVALMLSSSHPLTHGAWPYLPNIIEVAFVLGLFST